MVDTHSHFYNSPPMPRGSVKAAAHYAIRRAECRVRGGDTATFSENGATFRLRGRRNSKSRRRMSLTGVSAERRKKAEPVELFCGMSRRRTRTAARRGSHCHCLMQPLFDRLMRVLTDAKSRYSKKIEIRTPNIPLEQHHITVRTAQRTILRAGS